jgi:hypothetical protein
MSSTHVWEMRARTRSEHRPFSKSCHTALSTSTGPDCSPQQLSCTSCCKRYRLAHPSRLLCLPCRSDLSRTTTSIQPLLYAGRRLSVHRSSTSTPESVGPVDTDPHLDWHPCPYDSPCQMIGITLPTGLQDERYVRAC